MRRVSPTLFIGPIVNAKKRSNRVSAHSFQMFEAGEPIKLEYTLYVQAKEARAQLLKAQNAFAVPNQPLFNAIIKSIKEAHGPETTDP